MTNREKLLQEAKFWLGKEPTPDDAVPDDVACVSSLSHVIAGVIPFPHLVGTPALFTYLQKSPQWKATLDLTPGNVVVSVTGTGNGKIPNGHCGILLENERIASNSSPSGLWENNFSVTSWVKRYRTTGGMQVFIFEAV